MKLVDIVDNEQGVGSGLQQAVSYLLEIDFSL
jgi:hypothetical protein